MATPNYSRKMKEQVSEQLGELYATVAQGIKADNAVPNTTQINGHTLNGDVNLSAVDVEARPNNWLPTCAEINAEPIPSKAVENNFASYDGNRLIKDSGKNANSFLPNIYTSSNANNILTVGSNGVVQPSVSVPANIAPYDSSKSYVVNEAFYYGSNADEGIYITLVAHGPEAFNSIHNHMISKVGVTNDSLSFTLSAPVANQVYVVSGTLKQQMQGLLNNIKDLRDRISVLEGTAVTSDTPKVKLNISTQASTVQAGYKIVRINPDDIL